MNAFTGKLRSGGPLWWRVLAVVAGLIVVAALIARWRWAADPVYAALVSVKQIETPQLPYCVALSKDGGKVAFVMRPRILWDETTSPQPSIKISIEEMGTILGVAIAPDGDLVVAGVGHELICWDTESKTEKWRVSIRRGFISSNVIEPLSATIITGREGGTAFDQQHDIDESGGIEIRDLETGEVVRSVGEFLDGEVRTLAVSPDARHYGAGFTHSRVKAWETEDIREESHLIFDEAGPGPVASVALTDDGSLIAAAGAEGLKVWRVDSGECVFDLNTNQIWGHVEFVQKCRHLMGATLTRLTIWEIRGRSFVEKGSFPIGACRVDVSSDGRILAVPMYRAVSWKRYLGIFELPDLSKIPDRPAWRL